MIPEFVGRVPVIGVLEELSKEALVKILTEPRNAIVRQYKKLFEYEGVGLEFDSAAMEAVADLAIERELGARGLRMIMEELMLELMFELPSLDGSQDITITAEMIGNRELMSQLLKKAS
jgi:ATP-dependent Clp protease ATP-binding subunit ClpX